MEVRQIIKINEVWIQKYSGKIKIINILSSTLRYEKQITAEIQSWRGSSAYCVLTCQGFGRQKVHQKTVAAHITY